MATFNCPHGVLTFLRITLVDLTDSEVDESDSDEDWYDDVLEHSFIRVPSWGPASATDPANALHIVTTNAEYTAHVDGRIWCVSAMLGLRELSPESRLELSRDMKSVRIDNSPATGNEMSDKV